MWQIVKSFTGEICSLPRNAHRRSRRCNHIINFKHCQTRQLCNGEKWNFIALHVNSRGSHILAAFWDVFTDDLLPGHLAEAVRLGFRLDACCPVPTRSFCNRLASCISCNRIWQGFAECVEFFFFLFFHAVLVWHCVDVNESCESKNRTRQRDNRKPEKLQTNCFI